MKTRRIRDWESEPACVGTDSIHYPGLLTVILCNLALACNMSIPLYRYTVPKVSDTLEAARNDQSLQKEDAGCHDWYNNFNLRLAGLWVPLYVSIDHHFLYLAVAVVAFVDRPGFQAGTALTKSDRISNLSSLICNGLTRRGFRTMKPSPHSYGLHPSIPFQCPTFRPRDMPWSPRSVVPAPQS
jgi:hypothetical protein